MLSVLLTVGLAAVPSPAGAILQGFESAHVWVAEADAPDDTEAAPEDEVRKKKRKKVRLTPQEVVLVEGHGKGHYLAWGIVEWSLAGGLWVNSLLMGLTSLTAYAIAKDVRTLPEDDELLRRFDSRSEARQAYRTAGLVSAVVGVASGLLGGFFAYKASQNIGTYHEIRDQEAVILREKVTRPPPPPASPVEGVTL